MKEGLRQSMAWLHTWAGLVFGWLLFAIWLTGTLAYFQDEITHWAHPEIPVRALDTRTSLASAQTFINANAAHSPNVFISLPSHRDPVLGVMYKDPQKTGRGSFTRAMVDPQTGFKQETRESRGGAFFYRFHFELQMGYPWGRWLASAAAFVMFFTLVSGIITHKKIFKEFFTFRPGKAQRSWLDGHNAIGVLILPFHLLISYSSLVIFMTMIMPASIMTSYHGDPKGFFNDVFPSVAPAPASGEPTPLMPLTELYDKALEQWPAARISRVELERPADAAPTVEFTRDDSESIAYTYGNNLVLNAQTGAVLSTPRSIPVPMLIGDGFYGLHMGHFAGPLLRWLYFLGGIGGTALIGTGLVMWLNKRQLKHAKSGVLPFELRLVEVLNLASMAGLLWAVPGFLLANRLLPVALEGRGDWEVRVFFGAWLLSLLHALLRRGRRAWIEQLLVAALLLAWVPLVSAMTTDHGVVRSIASGDWAMAGVDLTALAAALFLLWTTRKLMKKATVAKRKPAARQAEAVLESEVSP
jgi:uncharacterized iron-regulated membrane protein